MGIHKSLQQHRLQLSAVYSAVRWSIVISLQVHVQTDFHNKTSNAIMKPWLFFNCLSCSSIKIHTVLLFIFRTYT